MDTVGKSEPVLSCHHHKIMVKPDSGDTIPHNQRSWKSLARAINLASQKFSLILLRCNCEELKPYTQEILLQQYGIAVQTLVLPESTQNLCHYIEEQCQNNHPAALIILGLEAVTNLDELLVSTNQNRNEFGRKFSFPLILWVNDEVLQKMVRIAPDFYSWAGVPIKLVC